MKQYGSSHQLIFGVPESHLRLSGFPAGRVRLRFRANDYARAFVRPPDGGIREFAIAEKDGMWIPVYE